MTEKPIAISKDTVEAYALQGIPCEGFVEGKGSQSLMAKPGVAAIFKNEAVPSPSSNR